ncbi:MAG: LytTR family DNA-binding domain-containing protein [Pseudomonadota bacterium]
MNGTSNPADEEIPTRPDSAVHVGLASAMVVIGGLVLGSIGPFGDYIRLDLAARIGIWTLYCLVGMALYVGAYALVRRPIGIDHAVACLAAAVGLATPPMFLLIEIFGFALLDRPWPRSWPAAGLAMVEIAMIGGLMLGAYLALASLWRTRTDVPTAGRMVTRLISGGDEATVISVEAEGHYSRVYTAKGDWLESRSLSETVAALDPQSGALVHRSWWVRRDEVDRIVRFGSAHQLLLSNGQRVPLARRRRKQLRQLGWPV